MYWLELYAKINVYSFYFSVGLVGIILLVILGVYIYDRMYEIYLTVKWKIRDARRKDK